MADTPRAEVRPARRTDIPKAIVTYKAVVGLRLERSSMSFRSGVAESTIRPIVRRQPDWWEESGPYPGRGEASLERLALLKLKALFDFGATVKGATASEIRDALYSRYPEASHAAANEGALLFPVRQMRFEVTAEILENGTAQWGYVVPAYGRGDAPPPGVHRYSDPRIGGRSDLDLFVQNLVRADLCHRLGR